MCISCFRLEKKVEYEHNFYFIERKSSDETKNNPQKEGGDFNVSKDQFFRKFEGFQMAKNISYCLPENTVNSVHSRALLCLGYVLSIAVSGLTDSGIFISCHLSSPSKRRNNDSNSVTFGKGCGTCPKNFTRISLQISK